MTRLPVLVMTRRVSARSLATKRAVAREFARHASPYVLTLAIAVPAAVRTRLGTVRLQDAVGIGAVIVAQPFVEWSLHRHVLHARPRQVAGLTIDPGAAHRGHHQTPDDVAGALLGFGYAVVDTAMVAVGIGMVAPQPRHWPAHCRREACSPPSSRVKSA